MDCYFVFFLRTVHVFAHFWLSFSSSFPLIVNSALYIEDVNCPLWNKLQLFAHAWSGIQEKCLWSLSPVPGTEFLKLGMGTALLIHKNPILVIPELMPMKWLRVGPLDSLRMGLITRKTKLVLKRGWHFLPTQGPSGRGLGCEGAGYWALWTLEQWDFVELPSW